jgi:hypothetical protein
LRNRHPLDVQYARGAAEAAPMGSGHPKIFDPIAIGGCRRSFMRFWSAISYTNNHSVLWAIIHGLFSWLYVIYYVLFK